MGMRFPLWSRVVSGLRHHLMKKNIRHNALKKGQVTVRAPLWASLVGLGVFVNLKMIQDITFGGEGNPYPTSRQTTWMACLLTRPCRSENKCDICGNTLKSKFKLNNHIVKMRLKVPKMRNCVHVVGDWWFYQWIFLHCRGQTAERALCVEWFSTTLPLLFGQSSGRKDYLICSLWHCIVLILPRGEMPWHHLASPGAHKPGVFVLPYCEVLP